LHPGARRAIFLPSKRSSPVTNSGAPIGRPLPSDRRSSAKSSSPLSRIKFAKHVTRSSTGRTVTNLSLTPARWARTLDHLQFTINGDGGKTRIGTGCVNTIYMGYFVCQVVTEHFFPNVPIDQIPPIDPPPGIRDGQSAHAAVQFHLGSEASQEAAEPTFFPGAVCLARLSFVLCRSLLNRAVNCSYDCQHHKLNRYHPMP
jgi:hypothetical protein